MEFLTGRNTIALVDQDGNEVELNVTRALKYEYPVQITKHAVEQGAVVSDHVSTEQGSISLDVVISSTISVLKLSSTSASKKVEQLVKWRTYGTIVTLLGYGTGGLIKKLLSLLPSDSRFYPAEDPKDEFLGVGGEEITSLLISNLSYERNPKEGADLPATIRVTRVAIAVAKTKLLSSKVPNKGKAPVKTETKPESPKLKSTLSKASG